MSRRDTVIVAVLVNAALLMVLFATAIRSDPKPEKREERREFVKAPALEEPTLQTDLLNQYLAQSSPLSQSTETLHEELLTEEIPLPPLALLPAQPIPSPVKSLPLPQAEKEPQSPAQLATIVVKKGDFLEKIAKANQTSVSAIMKANHLSSTQLKIGQVLKVPVGKSSSREIPSVREEESYYIVKEGDSPWMIASRNQLKLDDLLRLNDLDEQKARHLRPGDRLKIR